MVVAIGEFQDGEDDRAARAELVRRMRTEGSLIAYETCLKVMLDPKSPANARTQAARSILDAGGFFRTTASDDAVPQDPATMTAAELEQEIARLKAPKMRSAATVPSNSLKTDNAFD